MVNNNDAVIEFLLNQLRQQLTNNPYKQQCEDPAHEVQSLKNQLRDASSQIKELHLALARATGDAEAYKLARKGGFVKGKSYVVGEHGPEQSGCRKEDTRECEHEQRVVQYSAGVETSKCRLCRAEKEVHYK